MIFPIVNHCYFEPMSRGEPHSPDVNHILTIFKKYFMAPFYGWGSTASRLEPIWGGNLLFPNKFPKVPGTQFINVRRIKVFDGRRISGPLSHPVVLNTGPLDWESSTLTTRPLLHKPKGHQVSQQSFSYWVGWGESPNRLPSPNFYPPTKNLSPPPH